MSQPTRMYRVVEAQVPRYHLLLLAGKTPDGPRFEMRAFDVVELNEDLFEIVNRDGKLQLSMVKVGLYDTPEEAAEAIAKEWDAEAERLRKVADQKAQVAAALRQRDWYAEAKKP